jgi:phosphoribosylglycinamide formyltransferase-1
MTVPIAVLASGSGSNLQALIDAELAPAKIAVVIVNVPNARAIERARARDLPVVVLDHKAYADREGFDRALVRELTARGVEWVVLAGFMRILSRVVLDVFPNRVVNIHPALLPSFPGTHAQRQAIQAGVKISGCTVHLVDEGTDTGPILAQAAVPVLPDDDEAKLGARILGEEHRLYAQVVRALAEGRLRLSGGRAFLEGFAR